MKINKGKDYCPWKREFNILNWVYQLGLLLLLLKHYDQSNLGTKGFIWFTYPESQSSEGSQDRRTQERQNLRTGIKVETNRSAAYWLASHGFLSMLCCRIQESSTMWWHSMMSQAFSHQSLIRKIPYRLSYSWILWRHFLNEALSSELTIACAELT